MTATGAMRILTITLFVLFIASSAAAVEVSVANSRDWVDVYSVQLHGALNDNRVTFLNSESMTGLLRTVSDRADLIVYESQERPFNRNLAPKLESAGYTVLEDARIDSFNLDLDPQNGRYFVISEDYYRISVAVAPIAIEEDRWVLVANADRIDEIAARLENAESVVAVGSFRRDLLARIEGSFDEWISEDSIFIESQMLAERSQDSSRLILSDGFSLEAEFFNAQTPVLLVGYNRITDQTYEWILENDVRNIVVIGNRLAVVGEQVRERSGRQIGVFIKFGQSDTQNTGRIYALTMFPLPQPLLGLTVQRAVYDPDLRQLIAYFENIGNIGLYETTTISVKNDDTEIGVASDDEILYIGTGEVLPKRYDVDIPVDEIGEDTVAEFFTSFGLSPGELDTFLTMEGRYGPPFSVPLIVASIETGDVQLELLDAAYYTRLNRIGVTLRNNGTEDVHHNVRIRRIIVNGLEEDLFASDVIRAGETKTTYLPVRLDEVDLEENTVLDIDIVYGASPDSLFSRIVEQRPFTVRAGGLLAGLAIGTGGAAIVGLVAVLLIAAIGMFIYIRGRR